MDGKLWKCDVAIVGGGAAGLAAAIRVRHVKEHDGLPLSVVLFEPGPLGGLLRAGEKRIITGPSHVTDSSQLLNDLVTDVKQLEIPIIPFRVTRVEKSASGRFLLHFSDGGMAEAGAVVLATGGRPMANEMEFYNDGIFVAYRGLSFIGSIIERACRFAGNEPIAVATTRHVRSLLPLYGKYTQDYRFLVPPGDELELQSMPGSVAACTHWEIIGRDDEAFTLAVDTPENGRLEMWAKAILIDYMSFLSGPQLPDLAFNLTVARNGVPIVDRYLQTSESGLFMAGDVTGRYATITSAIADGIAAGLGAYEASYTQQFGESPPLFHLRPDSSPDRFIEQELPTLTEQFTIEWLQTPPRGHPLVDSTGQTMEEISERCKLPLPRIYSLVYQAIRDRSMTVRPPIGG